jgi:nucleoid-associated protein YgaU
MADPSTVAPAHLTPIKSGSSGAKVGQPITFQFNPKEYTVQKKAEWERKPAPGAKKAVMPHYKGAGPATITLEMLIDGYEKQKDISSQVKALFELVKPTDEAVGKQKPSPNWVLFGWGSKSGDPYLVSSVQVKYTMFSSQGAPLRAVCTIALEELPIQAAKQNPSSGARTSMRSHLVVGGDSLASIAYAQYGDPAKWRAVADANDVDDPSRLLPGSRFLIPEIDAEVLA